MGIVSDFKGFINVVEDVKDDLIKEKSSFEAEADEISKYWTGVSGKSVKLLLEDISNEYKSIETDLDLLVSHINHNISVFENVREDYETKKKKGSKWNRLDRSSLG